MREALLKDLTLFETHQNDFGTIWYYDRLMWAEMNEGIHLVFENVKDMVNRAARYYENTGAIYLTNRINSYSTNVMDFRKMEKLPFLNAFAVISYKENTLINTAIEKLFFDKPFKTFKDPLDAVNWCFKEMKKPSFSK